MRNTRIVSENFKIIQDGVLYNTETAEVILQLETGSNYSWERKTLYRTKTGLFFSVRAYFGCHSNYDFRILSQSEALAFVGKIADLDLYAKISGETVKIA